jgi:hypothetical protein
VGVRAFRALAALALSAVCLSSGGMVSAAAGPITRTGNINGADYLIEIPANWNGDLLLYSHGYVEPGKPNPAQDAGDPGTRAYMLGQGYALAGGVGVWNVSLDAEFVFNTLLAPPGSRLQLVNISDPQANLTLAETLLAQAQATPQGRARIALVAAMADLPGWFDAASPEPAAKDFTTRELNQFDWESQVDFPFAFDLRAELEGRAGGNASPQKRLRQRVENSVSRDGGGAGGISAAHAIVVQRAWSKAREVHLVP